MYSPEEVEPGGFKFNPLNAELNSICHLLALLGAHHILHVSRIRVNVPAWNETCLQWKEIKPLVLSVISKLHCIIKNYIYSYFSASFLECLYHIVLLSLLFLSFYYYDFICYKYLLILTHWGRGHLNCLNARYRGF